MQHSGWRKGTIMARTGWSERTIKRAMECSTWPVYRGKVAMIVRNMKRARTRGVVIMGNIPLTGKHVVMPGDYVEGKGIYMGTEPTFEDTPPVHKSWPEPANRRVIPRWVGFALIILAIVLFWHWISR
jgi:hypothetical protein